MTEKQNHEFNLPLPPSNYIFDQPDSPDTIIFVQPPNKSLSNPYSDTADNNLIRAATKVKLVERLTHHLHIDPKLRHTFLMCYREFCTAREFFSLLIQRYEVPELHLSAKTIEYYASGGIIERELYKRYKTEYMQPIRQNVINIFRHWVDKYFSDDFANDQELFKDLQDFIQRVGTTNQSYQQVLLNIVNRKLNQQQLNDSNVSKLDTASVNSDASINSDRNFLKPAVFASKFDQLS